MKLRYLVVLATTTATLATTTSALATTTSAYAEAKPPPGAGWIRIHQQPFTNSAGTVCAFTLHGDIVTDIEWMRTTATYPDGSPKTQEFVGPLYVRFSNVESGESTLENLSGSALISYSPDGTQTYYVVGPFSVGFHAGNPYHAPGELLLDGLTKLVLHPGHVADVQFHYGPTQDICAAIR